MKVLLATLHAKYVHASLALPSLAAACSDLDSIDVVIREWTIHESRSKILARIVAEKPDVVAFSCYIWNIVETLTLIDELKLLRPDTVTVLGGPEASAGTFTLMEAHPAVDCVVKGEGEWSFREFLAELSRIGTRCDCREVPTTIPGVTSRRGDEIVAAPAPEPVTRLDLLPSPFGLGLVDLQKPLVYVETSRGCPFTCAFCTSSSDTGVHSFSLDRIKRDLLILMEAEVETVKLVDRTFNYNAPRALEIWSFILNNNRSSRFHFEIAADLLTDDHFRLLAEVPPATFRFEIGVQSGSAETLALVGRRSDLEKVYAHVKRLRQETEVDIHLDLVAGLPREDFGGFLASTEPLFALEPHHIQVEVLKVLKGTPMRTIAAREGYRYSPVPPYRILHTPWLSFEEICRIELYSRILDLVYNSGRFSTVLSLPRTVPPGHLFAALAEFWEKEAIPEVLSLYDLFLVLWRFFQAFLSETERDTCRDALCYDFCCSGEPQKRLPPFMGQPVSPPAREELQRIMSSQGTAPGGRVRSFAATFRRDYRTRPFVDEETSLLFVYESVAGKGQTVTVVRLP